MTEHPIIFSGKMVCAILAGCKTMTRRVIKPQPPAKWDTCEPVKNDAGGVIAEVFYSSVDRYDYGYKKPSYRVGNLLWVRETWSYITLAQNERQPGDKWDPQINMPVRMLYKADADAEGWDIPAKWSPSIFMPRWASRLTLRIESVHVERLWDITEADALAEGVDVSQTSTLTPVHAFSIVWDSLNERRGYPWMNNVWVWVVTFSKEKK